MGSAIGMRRSKVWEAMAVWVWVLSKDQSRDQSVGSVVDIRSKAIELLLNLYHCRSRMTQLLLQVKPGISSLLDGKGIKASGSKSMVVVDRAVGGCGKVVQPGRCRPSCLQLWQRLCTCRSVRIGFAGF
jgi:hypothetical protein